MGHESSDLYKGFDAEGADAIEPTGVKRGVEDEAGAIAKLRTTTSQRGKGLQECGGAARAEKSAGVEESEWSVGSDGGS